ncbi:hypothetical protein DO97_09590 [Neosynechococcus sphagnicola sy1]|uniref:Cofactor assembly of complex C subunit B n=1 Tax=Neosynechococcus sphagnicola sy1 TaxID=1497020 RepID=A0A098TJH4_9CYAN|nr:cofactor assembly of complex C subunit B [Neosynechococcus sphagnicola]KGF72339.1 hypothetical protein DO97_09590 [Neosynechococcus sphagnicola sy1]
MNSPVLTSTFFLTLLLVIGLVFFIRASVKDRIQAVKLVAEQSESSLLEQLQDYLTQRAYRIAAVDATQNQVTYVGMVRPSWFLAIFLSLLAAVGLLCLTLVLAMLVPDWAAVLLGLPLLSPMAGVFYWRNAGRPEQVCLRVEPRLGTASPHCWITVIAHRDELAALQQALLLKVCEE